MSWAESAMCSGLPSHWFVPQEQSMTAQEQQWKEGKFGQNVCRGCPVATDCLKEALESNEKFGVWGGALPNARHALRREWKDHDADLDELADRYVGRMREGKHGW